MFSESGFNIYISRALVIEEQYDDARLVEAEQQRLHFYAVLEQVREHWFELEEEFRRNGDARPLDNLIAQIRAAAAHQD